LKLAAVGRLLNESEATVSRKLARCRTDLRRAVERRLRELHGMGADQVAECFDLARTDPAFDLARVLPPPFADEPLALRVQAIDASPFLILKQDSGFRIQDSLIPES
jgi:hypothetical protein